MRNIFLVIMILFSTSVYAQKQQIEVVSRFDTSKTTAIVAMEFIRILNKTQTKFEFRFVALPGAAGEIADIRAISLTRSNIPTLVLGSTSSWALNRYTFGNTFDRDNDLVPLIGFGGVPFAIQVSPNSKIENLDQLVNSIRNKKESYHATTVSGSASNFFANVFIDYYQLSNVKHISYRLSSDMVYSIINNETDFAISNIADSLPLKSIAISSEERLSFLSNTATGKEIGRAHV